jgi:hypothetical protein
MTTQSIQNSSGHCEAIKHGIDAHANWYCSIRQFDGATPQPVQKMTFEEMLLFAGRRQKLAGRIFTSYEAVS